MSQHLSCWIARKRLSFQRQNHRNYIDFRFSNVLQTCLLSYDFQEEKEFIIEATQSTQGKLPPPPFKHIFASVPFWTLAFTFLCFSWGFFTLISMIPTYLNNIQHIPLSEVSLKPFASLKVTLHGFLQNGILSATPYLLNWVFAVACGWIADYFISSGKLSRAFVRKSLTLLGCAAPGAFLIALSFIKCNPELALTCLCLGCFLNGASYSGFNINSGNNDR